MEWVVVFLAVVLPLVPLGYPEADEGPEEVLQAACRMVNPLVVPPVPDVVVEAPQGAVQRGIQVGSLDPLFTWKQTVADKLNSLVVNFIVGSFR